MEGKGREGSGDMAGTDCKQKVCALDGWAEMDREGSGDASNLSEPVKTFTTLPVGGCQLLPSKGENT